MGFKRGLNTASLRGGNGGAASARENLGKTTLTWRGPSVSGCGVRFARVREGRLGTGPGGLSGLDSVLGQNGSAGLFHFLLSFSISNLIS